MAIYYGFPKHTGDVQCIMCKCWIDGPYKTNPQGAPLCDACFGVAQEFEKVKNSSTESLTEELLDLMCERLSRMELRLFQIEMKITELEKECRTGME